MYSTNQILKAIRQPQKILREIEKFSGKIQNNYRGCAVMDEDWDNLVILDACRYDMFERLNTIEGRLEHRRSRGSATWEFSQNNYAGKQFFDTVYVNGNPNVSLVASESFHELRDVWRTDWDHEYGTVMPDVMERHTLEAAEAYPNKRIVAHFMQPHHPFLGPTAETELHGLNGNEATRLKALARDDQTAAGRGNPAHVWARFERGEVEMKTLKKAYYETLEKVLPHIAALCDQLPGRTVVTSDHGNLLGERAHPWLPWETQRFAHPDYATATALVRVPWLVHETDVRKQITTEPPKRNASVYDEDDLNEKLESLGYV